MNDTQKLELVEKAREEFERNVKAALDIEEVHVAVNIHMQDRLVDNAPDNWVRGTFFEGTRYAESGYCLSATNVFGVKPKP